MTRALAPLVLLGLLASCGNGDAMPWDGDGDGDLPGDTNISNPRVVTSVPTASATGVGTDAVVLITFSEAMDRASTEAACVLVSSAAVAGGDVLSAAPI
jgi:hypothetical protein